jgi:glycosyltransferase involved in cell wall biosynthesis
MTTLSLAMIVKNEEATLGHCLASVRGLVDEIVVVDTGSTDGTLALAEAHGAKITQFPWIDDFAAARNESLRRCTGDWVLVLDADEAVDSKDHSLIRQAIRKDRPAAYRLLLRNYFLDGNQTSVDEAATLNESLYTEGSQFRYYADGRGLRLCRRLAGLAFRGRIHELLDPFFEERKSAIADLDAVVHHYGKTFKDREAVKLRYYLGLAEREARAHPGNHQFWFNLLQQALCANEWELTLEAAQTYLKLRKQAPPMVALGAGMALQFLGRTEESLPYFDAILGSKPDHSAALVRKAVTLAALGRQPEARDCLRKAIAANPGFVTSYVNLAELEGQLGDPGKAREALLAGLQVAPSDPILLHALVQLSLEHGQTGQAVQDAWMAIQRCPGGGQGSWHRLVAWSLAKAGSPSQALAIVDLGLTAFPGHEALENLRKTLPAKP